MSWHLPEIHLNQHEQKWAEALGEALPLEQAIETATPITTARKLPIIPEPERIQRSHSNGYFNITNPARLVYPEVNELHPFERIKASERENLRSFWDVDSLNGRSLWHREL